MQNVLSNLYEQAGELKDDVAETALACNEIVGRAWSTLVQEQNEMMGAYLETVEKQYAAMTQARSLQELVVREAQTLTEMTKRMRQSVQEVRGIQRVATAELSLCLEDGWKAIQSRTVPAGLLGG